MAVNMKIAIQFIADYEYPAGASDQTPKIKAPKVPLSDAELFCIKSA
jgi:hypothetical protein